MIRHFFNYDDCKLEDLGNGIKRKVLSFNKNLMVVEVNYEKGAVGALHEHPHEQCTYIINGEFEFEIDGKKQVLRAGDSTYMEPDVRHGAVCLKPGKILDIFTPCREDFLGGEK